MYGEGRLLGGTLVIGPGDTGVVYDFREVEFGDIVPIEKVVAAVKTIGNEDYAKTAAAKRKLAVASRNRLLYEDETAASNQSQRDDIDISQLDTTVRFCSVG